MNKIVKKINELELNVIQKVLLTVVAVICCFCIISVVFFNTFNAPCGHVLVNGEFESKSTTVNETNFVFKPASVNIENIRLRFSSLTQDRSGSIEISLYHSGDEIYKGKQKIKDINEGEWSYFYTNLRVNLDEDYSCLITVKDAVNPNEVQWIWESYPGLEMPSISFGYSDDLRIRDKMLVSLFIVIVSTLVGIITLHIKNIVKIINIYYLKIADNLTLKPLCILELIGIYICLEIAELDIGMMTKGIISIFGFLATCYCVNKADRISEISQNVKVRVSKNILSLWFAFALIGSKCFVYPISGEFRIGKYFTYLILYLLMLPIASMLICVLTKPRLNVDFNWKRTLGIVWWIVISLGVSFVFYNRAFNPAISSPDTKHCMHYAISSLKGIDDWHPTFYIMWLKAILSVWRASEAVTIFQYSFFAYVLIRGIFVLSKRGVPTPWLFIGSIFCTLNCANIVHLTTIWKDIPYTLSILWLTIIISELFTIKENSIYVYVELVFALVGTCLFRQAGFVPFICVVLGAGFVFKKNKKVVISLIMSIVAVVVIKGPIYNSLDIQQDHGGGIYIGLGQDIMGAYYNGGNLSQEAIEIVATLTEGNLAGYDYSPYWANSSYDLDISMPQFLKVYIDTFIHNPMLMSKTILCRMDYCWDIFMGQDGIMGCVNFTGSMDYDSQWTNEWRNREYNFISEELQKYLDYTVENPLINSIIWRTGIWFGIIILVIAILVITDNIKMYYLVLIPSLSHILSLLLSTGWSDFRYVWPINLMVLFVSAFVLSLNKKENV